MNLYVLITIGLVLSLFTGAAIHIVNLQLRQQKDEVHFNAARKAFNEGQWDEVLTESDSITTDYYKKQLDPLIEKAKAEKIAPSIEKSKPPPIIPDLQLAR